MAHNYNLLYLSKYDFAAVMEATSEGPKAAAWAMEVGLLEKQMLCPQCTQPMRLNPKARHAARRHITTTKSILVNSWFSKMKLTLPQALRLMFAWCMRAPQPQAAHMANYSERTVSDWYAACRVLCSKELLGGEFKIGGDGHIVEIDETSLKKKSKYGRGRHYKEFWLFGGVDRATGQWFGRIVYDKRTKATLLPIIKQFIKPRTRIHSDMFATYVTERGARTHTLANNRTLASMHYEHSWVNHTLNFVDPVTGTHTNTIEGLWEMHIKRHIKAMRGMTQKYLDGYIDEYMWRSWFFPPRCSPGEYMCGLVQAVIRHPKQEE
ncbi:hypothetical protein PHMEG_00013279 [Phytophthora megakarya]|uniref:ISXO2-like transposase domain-containing protein n=1 Tax=Phytophthora megakarya TaxID=4795 RepID=A0A225W6M2_9STRA|nr:hypothetical protein PHMEG_00013279 [Phytophthora megakarya]